MAEPVFLMAVPPTLAYITDIQQTYFLMEEWMTK